MPDFSREVIQGVDVVYLGPYQPWKSHVENGGGGGDYPRHSAYVWDIKKQRKPGQDYFYNLIKASMRDGYVICTVPSHDPANTANGVNALARRFVETGKCLDGLQCLARHTKIAKLSAGGSRSVAIHLGSIAVTDAKIVAGKPVLLLDDIITTGTSLVACAQLLMDAGAARVQALALGRTPRHDPI